MSLDVTEVENIAMLCRIGISAEELPQYQASLNNILGLVDQLQSVNTDGVEPLANPLDATQRLRADDVSETNQRDKYQQCAPSTESGFYLVPKVVE